MLLVPALEFGHAESPQPCFLDLGSGSLEDIQLNGVGGL